MSAHRTQPKSWMYAVVCFTAGAVVAALVMAQSTGMGSAMAQTDQRSSDTAVSVVPFEGGAGSITGFVLVNHERKILCVYQLDYQGPAHERLALVATRDYQYDCQLPEFNTAEPRPATVRELLRQAFNASPQ